MYKIHKRFISHLLCIAILLPALLVPSHAINSNDIYSIPTTFDHSSTVVMPDTTSTINYESPLTEDFLEILEYAPPGSAVRVDSEGNVSLVDKSNQVYSNIPDQTTDFGSMSSTNSTNNDAPVTLDATPDTRTRVRNVNDYPNCAVVEIVSTFPDGGVLRGSGAFIGPKGILTAGHVLYQKEHGIASSVTIYPGGGLSNFSPIEKDELFISPDWLKSEKSDKDYAIITVAKSPNVGYWGSWYFAETSNLLKQDIYRLAFPGDKTRSTLWNSGTAHVGAADKNIFTHEGYAYGGESGGPVISIEKGKIIGLHIGSTPGFDGFYGCYVQRISYEVLQFMFNYGGAVPEE